MTSDEYRQNAMDALFNATQYATKARSNEHGREERNTNVATSQAWSQIASCWIALLGATKPTPPEGAP